MTTPTDNVPGAVEEWIVVNDPSDPTQRYSVNKTAMLSNYSCIYGRGCKGIKDHRTRDDHAHGCCAWGAYFADKEDFERVKAAAKDLTSDDWEMKAEFDDRWWVDRTNGKTFTDDDAEYPVKTRVKDGGCVFSNRTPGKQGCAFHYNAKRTGRNYADLQPNVCTTVPFYVNYEVDDDGVETTTLSLRTAEDWGGAEGFDYWCTDDPAAFMHDSTTWVNMKRELRHILGDRAYDLIGEALQVRSTVLPADPRFLPIVEVT